MKTISTSEMPALRFTQEKQTQPFCSQSPKIGWLTAKANKVGASGEVDPVAVAQASFGATNKIAYQIEIGQ